MKKKEIEQFEKIHAQIEGFHNEISTLAKKSPNDGLNEFKIKLINQVLLLANKILGERYKPFKDFQSFNLDDLPSNSDVTFVLSQYFNCMEKLRLENVTDDFDYNAHKSDWAWVDNEKMKTSPPKKLK